MRVPFFGAINREVRGMHQAAYVLAALALGSQLLALLRDRLLAATFGASHILDLYYAAFRIPDFLFATIASLLSLYALLPVLSRLEASQPGRMMTFLRGALLFFFLAMGGIAIVLFFMTPWLALLIAPGIAGPSLILLMRILLLQPILLGASNTIASFTQLRHRFILYSISPLLYNLGIIFGVLILYPLFGIAGLGWGVVLGAFFHLMVQVPFFSSESGQPMPWHDIAHALKEVLTLSVPRTLALAANQITLLVLVGLASVFAVGSIAVFMFAYNLQAVPLTLIGVSYSVAAFPTLARLHANGQKEDFIRHIETALRHIFLWSIVATVFIIVLRAQLVRVILGAGAFDWTATRLTAAALALFILSLLAQNASMLIDRVYFAAGNTIRPLLYGVSDVFFSIVSAFLFIFLFHAYPLLQEFVNALLRVDDVQGTIVLTLAIAYAFGSIMQFLISLFFFVRDFKVPLHSVWRLCFEIGSASIIGSSVSYLILAFIGSRINLNTTLGVLWQGTAAGIGGLIITLGILWLLGNPELQEAVIALRRRFVPDTTTLEPTDIAA